jgi:hypothetical protein
MNEYPCKECLLKCNCSEFCDKVIGSSWTTTAGPFWSSFGIEDHMDINGSCPDCGGRRGRRYNDGFVCIMECDECFSSFYPNSKGITRHRKGRGTKGFYNTFPTTFRHYINVLVKEYRGTYLVQELKKS